MVTNSSWCPWPIDILSGLRNGSYCLRCDFSVSSIVSQRWSALLRVFHTNQNQRYLTSDDLSVLVSDQQLISSANFNFSCKEIVYRYLRSFNMERPPWRVNGSVIYSYNCYWALPGQLLSNPNSAGLVTIPNWLIWNWIQFCPFSRLAVLRWKGS
jgi:hypothetical protein